MNHNDPSHRSPPRAEPLQPDRPGRGTGKEAASGNAAEKGQQGDTAEGGKKLKEQADVAVENAREGYGGS